MIDKNLKAFDILITIDKGTHKARIVVVDENLRDYILSLADKVEKGNKGIALKISYFSKDLEILEVKE